MRRGILAFLTIFQSILFAAHLFVLETWLHFWGVAPGRTLLAERIAATLLALSFVTASLLSFRFWNAFTRNFYRFAAAWVGIANFLFFASLGAWLTAGAKAAAGFGWSNRAIVAVWFGFAIAAALWGMINASLTRVNRITV